MLAPIVIEDSNVVDEAFDISNNIITKDLDFFEHCLGPRGTVGEAHW
jgi:hypothetical protein